MINTSTAGDAALSVAKKSQGERLTGSAAATMETKQTALPRRFQNQKLPAAVLRLYHKLKLGQETVLRPVLSQLQELRERELRSNRKISDIDK